MDLGNVVETLSTTAAGGAIVVLVAKAAIQKHLRSVDESAKLLRELDKTLAILQSHMNVRFEALERDLNNIGHIVRGMKK